MPAPPPPSKSYNLVLDSDSSDESENEYRCRRQQDYITRQRKIETIAPSQLFEFRDNIHPEAIINTSQLTANQLSGTTPKEPAPLVSPPPSPSRGEFQETSSKPGNDNQTHDNQQKKKLTKGQKKRLQRKKKKKAARKQEIAEDKICEENPKRVSFSNVAIRAYPRTFSADTVPGHGGWPLGMKLEGYEDMCEISLEEYESKKQDHLHERWVAILSSEKKKSSGSPSKCSSPSKRKKEKEKVIDEQIIRFVDGSTTVSSCDKDDSNDTSCKNTIYESRQWDYRSRVRNPLFGLVSEDERHAIFLQASNIDPKKTLESPTLSNNRRKRSNSMGNHNHGGGSSRSRSNSLGIHDLENSMKGKFNEEYNQAMVHHVRNDLEQIRFERNKSGATGCNCRKLVVYLPPKDGSGGKKAQHRRLKPSKVVQELKKRNLYDEKVASMSREQMEKLLHKTVENEPCCRDESCFCVRNGIICQADACSCWHDSHVHAKHSSNCDILSNDDIRKRCGNPLGTYLVDVNAIDRYRREKINQTRESNENDVFICRPVSAS